jgi:hypothetical protein
MGNTLPKLHQVNGMAYNNGPNAIHGGIITSFDAYLSQPYFEGSVRMKLTFLELGLGSPLGLLKLHSLIAGVKTPCIGAFFISLES